MRWLLALFCLSFASLSSAAFTVTIEKKPLSELAPNVIDPVHSVTPSVPPALANAVIDKVLVLKSAHQLQLLSHGQPLKTYRVSLGKSPHGPKEYEGDLRTPEGFYWLDWRKVSDRFNLAIHVSYPNVTDAAKARNAGLPPGGMIMIHGTPDSEDYPEWYFNTLDWTDGCIAMKNQDMRELWSMVKDGTMIEIRP
ncbi:hypothetical protein PMM47T1_04464 [Pseudomonas sp. M47T1]|nr:L,D-transpeptidase family protein [Pseudomonas sp. M47T1]EIK97735.1 hypothetical protein PMM47T1_04464 [Pseudomonas sp. M47T1]